MGAQKVKGKFVAAVADPGRRGPEVRRRPAVERGHQGSPRDAEDAGARAGRRARCWSSCRRSCMLKAGHERARRSDGEPGGPVQGRRERAGVADHRDDRLHRPGGGPDHVRAGEARSDHRADRGARTSRSCCTTWVRASSPATPPTTRCCSVKVAYRVHTFWGRRQWQTPFAALNKACVKAFGSPVTYQQGAGGVRSPITGILQKDSDEERHQDGVYARLFVGLADFAARPDHGDVATVNGVTYTVFEVLADRDRAADARRAARSTREVRMASVRIYQKKADPAGPAELPAGADVQDRQRRRGGGQEPPGGGAGADRRRRRSRSPSGMRSGKPRWARATAAT